MRVNRAQKALTNDSYPAAFTMLNLHHPYKNDAPYDSVPSNFYDNVHIPATRKMRSFIHTQNHGHLQRRDSY